MSSGNKALLASASYIDFFNSDGYMKNKEKIEENLKGVRGLTESQINQFLDTYEVLDQQLETASGFSAMVVREKSSGKNLFVIRGTQEPVDFLQDGMLVATGLAKAQVIDALNYFNKVTTPKGQTYNEIVSKITSPLSSSFSISI
ncbi:hypothetical protein ACU6T4_07925 [Avibacterium paragallinarum]|uniref:hypothetical protein n=1 Tax=Avibacterium paragallinarum TaxID=728 RepID=UPI001029442E|nr:hypothetical protein [Avibacterium paragallinarum]QJE10075.1 hypothetical protein HHJ62_07105 [Avibacterium paragallinarum]QJE12269.1 hypothetical protein HHJ61_07110 [Avibacterium paragallinarum]QJE14472.1 hypothetical protein HHJ60_07130 [Avibacterium paragallinarum]QJE16671.1 hypothetical protein HHJ59_07120 [Avibacterium paragallinarum]QJE18865.1 hypothetical protein HHJ57_07105 [Avibacterium paragallinarum]